MAHIDVAPYRAFWRKRAQAKPTPDMLKAMEAARSEAQRLAKILAEEFGVQRVYLFGSFAWGIDVNTASDVDLAAEGLPPGKLIAADIHLSDASLYSVDLVRLEHLPSPLRDLIMKSGVLLYDKPKDDSRAVAS